MNRRSLFASVGIGMIAALLAFPFREAVNQLVVVPIAYVLWLVRLYYRSIDQAFWWLGIVLIALIVVGSSLLPEIKPKWKKIDLTREERGGVESLARAIHKSQNGIYFKWSVANRLGRLAQQMLSLREHGKPRSPFAPLTAEGWTPPDEVQRYLEKGLRGSFADFPNSNWNYFSPPAKTSLDHDASEVVEFLESKMTDKPGG